MDKFGKQKLNKRYMTTNKRNQNGTGQLSTHNIFYQTFVPYTEGLQCFDTVGWAAGTTSGL